MFVKRSTSLDLSSITSPLFWPRHSLGVAKSSLRWGRPITGRLLLFDGVSINISLTSHRLWHLPMYPPPYPGKSAHDIYTRSERGDRTRFHYSSLLSHPFDTWPNDRQTDWPIHWPTGCILSWLFNNNVLVTAVCISKTTSCPSLSVSWTSMMKIQKIINIKISLSGLIILAPNLNYSQRSKLIDKVSADSRSTQEPWYCVRPAVSAMAIVVLPSLTMTHNRWPSWPQYATWHRNCHSRSEPSGVE